MNYPQTLDYLFSQLPMFHRIGGAAYKADLHTTVELCSQLGDPQTRFLSIHIAGTNGKGSTAHLLASVLQASGMKTGLYTSPHLKDFRERIRINGTMIPKKDVTLFVEKNIPLFGKLKPSFFEMTFALAMQYFADKEVEIAVVETGMGGRFDSTNIIRPVLSIITNIGYDHMAFLGDTLEKIAREKAGIIKAGITVIIGQTHPKTAAIFKETAHRSGSVISFADKCIRLKNIRNYFPLDQIFEFDVFFNKDMPIRQIKCPLAGNYQLKNFKTVFLAIQKLKDQDFSIPVKAIRTGFEQVISSTGLAGRWHLLAKEPLVICDTGHNTDGIKEVVRQIRSLEMNQIHVVLGIVEDKDVEGVLKLFPRSARYYFCKANIPRGLDANVLAENAEKFGLEGQVFSSVKQAYQAALMRAGKGDLVFIGGSTFTVAEIL